MKNRNKVAEIISIVAMLFAVVLIAALSVSIFKRDKDDSVSTDSQIQSSTQTGTSYAYIEQDLSVNYMTWSYWYDPFFQKTYGGIKVDVDCTRDLRDEVLSDSNKSFGIIKAWVGDKKTVMNRAVNSDWHTVLSSSGVEYEDKTINMSQMFDSDTLTFMDTYAAHLYVVTDEQLQETGNYNKNFVIIPYVKDVSNGKTAYKYAVPTNNRSYYDMTTTPVNVVSRTLSIGNYFDTSKQLGATERAKMETIIDYAIDTLNGEELVADGTQISGTLNITSKTIKVGESFQLSFAMNPDLPIDIIWKSTGMVECPNYEGKVVGKKAGTYTCSAIVAGQAYMCTVYVVAD